MIKILIKAWLLFFAWKPKGWRKAKKMALASRFYSVGIRRKAKSCGSNLLVLGEGVNVTSRTVIGDGVCFGKNVVVRGDGSVFLGKRVSIAEDTVIYTQIHDYDHGDDLPFGWTFTYPETKIDAYAWIGLRCLVMPGAHIGEGAIVQAGSVVMGKVPPCAIVAGNPAKVIGWRDVEHYNRLKVAVGETPVVMGADSCDESKTSGVNGDDRMTDVFCSVFSVPPDEAVSMTYKNHPAWDSAGQMALVAAIERAFGISLLPDDIYRLRSYGDACGLLASRDSVQPGYTLPIVNLDHGGVAVIEGDCRITYHELAKLADEAVCGVEPHSVKVIVNRQDLRTVALMIGCLNHGVVPLLLPKRIAPELLADFRKAYDGKPAAKELAVLLTTSGSTGSPKLVRISRKNLLVGNKMNVRLFNLDESTRMMMVLPVCHAWGMNVLLMTLEAGGTVVMSCNSVLDQDFPMLMESAMVSHFAGVPYMFEMLERISYFDSALPNLRCLMIAGGALSPSLRKSSARRARARGWSFIEAYGQTETTGVASILRTDTCLEHVGSIGRSASCGSYRIDGEELVYEGELAAMGYANSPEDLTKGDDWNGVRYTGDLATIDADGYVTLTGRISRFLKIFGYRVSLDDVENIVKDRFQGTDCAATGSDDNMCVFVTDCDPAEIERYLVSTMHFNTTVVKVRRVDAIPLNLNGKIDYPKLKEMCAVHDKV